MNKSLDEQIPLAVAQQPAVPNSRLSQNVTPPITYANSSYSQQEHAIRSATALSTRKLVFGISLLLLLVAAGGTAAYSLMRSSSGTASKATVAPAITESATPHVIAPEPAKGTTDPNQLASYTYDNGVGQKFSLLFYGNPEWITAGSLPSNSAMSFIADKAMILRQKTAKSGQSPLLLVIATDAGAQALKAVQNNNSSGVCSITPFSVQLKAGATVKVCTGSDKTLYAMTYFQDNIGYYVNVTTQSDADLTPFNEDLQKILASIVPL